MEFRFSSILLLMLLIAAGVCAQSDAAKVVSAPVYIGIAVDCSGPQRLQLDRTIGAMKQIVAAMHGDDQAFVLKFIDAAKTSVVQDLTSAKPELNDAADALYVEAGRTAITDAVAGSVDYFEENKETSVGNRVLILITNGEDRGSIKKPEEVAALLKEHQVRVFAIAVSDLPVSTKLLDRFTKETGGKTFVPRVPADLSNAVSDIIKALRMPLAAQNK